MRIVGQDPSWHVDQDDLSSTLDHALLVRDAFGVDAGPDLPLPPARRGAEEALVSRLTRRQREQLAAAWPVWWRAVLTTEQLRDSPDGALVDGVWREDLNAAVATAGFPPDFETLADRPALQWAARVTWPEAQRARSAWRRARGDHLEERARRFQEEHEVVEEAFREVASAAELTVAAVRVRLLVVRGDVPWWSVVAPGVALTTTATQQDIDQFRALLRRASASAL